jgi:hypothetical protein
MLRPLFTAWILIVCVQISRSCLWLFDLSISQMVQEDIYQVDKRQEYSAAQTALCNLFTTLIYVTDLNQIFFFFF